MDKLELSREYRDRIELEVITEIVKDFNEGDYTVFSELVSGISVDVLAGSLSHDIINYNNGVLPSNLVSNQKISADFLDQLAGKRFSKTQLEEKLSEFFQEQILLEEIEENIDTDKNFVFEVKQLIYLTSDIYCLPTYEKHLGEVRYYITEVAYNFED